MKITHDGVEFDVPNRPVLTGYEFNEYRKAKYQEQYYFAEAISTWDYQHDSKHKYWIATRKPVKPVVDGWAFLEDEPRLGKNGEWYFSEKSGVICRVHDKFTQFQYWIATRKPEPEPKARKVVRREIKQDDDELSCSYNIGRNGLALSGLHYLITNPDFIGFEFENGVVQATPIMYYNRIVDAPVLSSSIKYMENNVDKVHHAKFALFFE